MTKLTLSIILLLASCTQKSEAWEGREGESCRPDESCDEELICQDEKCRTPRQAIEMLKDGQKEILRKLQELDEVRPGAKKDRP